MVKEKKVSGISKVEKMVFIPVYICIFTLFTSLQVTEVFAQEQCKGPAKEVLSTKKGISRKLMKKYHAITDKYLDTLDGKKVYNLPKRSDIFSEEEQDIMYTIFIQMSPAQQNEQVFFFSYPFYHLDPPLDSIMTWQDSSKYLIWIDTQKVENFDLGKYVPTDFGGYDIRRHDQVWDDYYGDKRTRVKLYTTEYCDRRPPLSYGAKSIQMFDDREILHLFESEE